MMPIKSEIIEKALKKIRENLKLPPRASKIAVAMSGGVDSSVVTTLLKYLDMDYELIGVTAWLSERTNDSCKDGKLDAAKVAEYLGIKHHVVDLREDFQKIIIDGFLGKYAEGLTPVPCMVCNTEMKWGLLFDKAKELGAEYIASGHYAKILFLEEINKYCIAKGIDQKKDQSYMLWTLKQAQMEKTIYLLSIFTKEEIREIANEFGLFNSNKKESQDVCFIPEGTNKYLKEKIGQKPGQIRYIKTDEIMGEHFGTHLYTIGQRKGIGIAHANPLYVIKINALENIIYVGEEEYLLKSELKAEEMNWQGLSESELEILSKNGFEGLVKIRYATVPAKAKIYPNILENYCRIEFEEQQSSITPGQAVVIYNQKNQYILGGGWISLIQ